MAGTWSPGQAAVGQRVYNEPVTYNGVATLQKGVATFPPTVVTPGTVASPGTVVNTTGVDVMVYASASTTMGSVKIGWSGTTVTLTGTAYAGQMVPIYVPVNGWVALTYTGTLTWTWLGI